MGRRVWSALSVALFVVGTGSLGLTLYLWFGDWPQQTREVVDHLRSAAANAQRAPDPTIQNVHARDHVDLGGRWRAVIDPYGRAELGGIAPRAVEPKTPSDLAEFSFENGLTLAVPGDWNTQDPRLVFYRGPVWYKRTFEFTRPQQARRHFLWIGAANYEAKVFLNGHLLGRHEGGFTPFNFEVGEWLREGPNLLVIRVDNEKQRDDVPTPMTDWLNYGGLTREVLLLSLPPAFVLDYGVGLDPASPGRIAGFVQLAGDPAGEAPLPQSVTLRIPDLGVEVSLATDASGRAAFSLPADPERWSPERPRLYRVELETSTDRVADQIGFRTIEAHGSEIRLNGEPIFLRGISIHEEAMGEAGRAHSPAHAEALLAWVRELEGNFVRLAHYPHSEHMARAADRLGLLVWEEIPVYWNIDFGNPTTLERAKLQLSELIDRDRNRASVVLWSIGNETPSGEERLAFMGALADHARSQDPTRLVTAALLPTAGEMARFFLRAYLPAMLGLPHGEWVYAVHDPLAERVDVQALNEYFGWYYSGAVGAIGPISSHRARRVMLDNVPRIRLRSESGKPMILSEFGAGALAGKHHPEADLVAFSEEYQALVYTAQLAMIEQQEGLAGISPWVLKDFRSPLRLYQGVQDYWNLKGLVSKDGERKQAFGVLRDYYRSKRREAERAAAGIRPRATGDRPRPG